MMEAAQEKKVKQFLTFKERTRVVEWLKDNLDVAQFDSFPVIAEKAATALGLDKLSPYHIKSAVVDAEIERKSRRSNREVPNALARIEYLERSLDQLILIVEVIASAADGLPDIQTVQLHGLVERAITRLKNNAG